MTDVASTAVESSASPGATESKTFDQFLIAPEVLSAIAAMGYKSPTEVQDAVLDAGIAGRDLVVQSKTGSGKTSAFGIPMVQRLQKGQNVAHRPRGLVLAPTRELAAQVSNELRALATHKGLRVGAVYGGTPMGKQIGLLKTGLDIVVATPGRLLDHIGRQNVSLEQIEVVVLDEADEMLSMGFWDDVTEILRQLPANRQTMLFSATLPYDVAKAVSQYQREPLRCDLSGDTLSVEGIDNKIYHVLADVPKPRQLLNILESERPQSAVIFCNTRNETEMLAKYLTQSGFVARPLAGNFKQRERERVVNAIKGGELRYMVATDVAARGIDINDLTHVFNYSLPEFSEVYLHRAGRTGRIGKLGVVISLLDGKGLSTYGTLEKQFGIKFSDYVPFEENEILRKRSERIMKELLEKAAVSEVTQHVPVAEEIMKSAEANQIVAFLLKSYFSAQADVQRPVARDTQVETQPDHEQQSFSSRQNNGERGRRRRGRGRRGRMEYIDAVDASDLLASEPGFSVPPTVKVESAASILATAPTVETPSTAAPVPAAPEAPVAAEVPSDGLTRIRVNIGFDDGFKGRGAVAKKICALAGLNDGIVTEIESKRDHAVLKAAPEVAELLMERVDGAQIGKKILTLSVA